MEQQKKIILTFIGYYLPGYKSGGPVRTISNMLNLLAGHYDFNIITRDRDQLENKTYDGIKVNEWNEAANCSIYYLPSPLSLRARGIREVINNTTFDVYYLNSFFDFHFSIKIIALLMLKLIPAKPVILAPRGELSNGALSLKSIKKRAYLAAAKNLNLYNNITWHASSKYEAAEIKREFGDEVRIKIALDIPDFSLPKVERIHKKEAGKLRILFISGITPKKNLYYVIDVLNKVQGDFALDIYGPVKDEKYWHKYLKHIDERIKDRISYKGTIHNSQVHTVYPNYDLFFFPTLGENFGHVIFESLFFGTPVLCSGTTPWDKLDEFNAGWNIELSSTDKFVKLIEKFILSGEDEYDIFIRGCKKYLSSLKNDKRIIDDNIEILNNLGKK